MKFLTILLIAVCAKNLSAQTVSCNYREGRGTRGVSAATPFACFLVIKNPTGLDKYASLGSNPANQNLANVQAIRSEEGSTTTVFPSILSKKLTAVTHVDFANGGLKSIGVTAFSGFSQLHAVFLNNNAIKSIHADAFVNNPWLKWIDLSNNQLSSIPAGLFRSQTGVFSLQLSGNTFTTLPSGLFLSFNQLSYFEVKNCANLASLGSNFFANLGFVEIVVISGNKKLSTLPADFFNGLNSMKYLYLNDNNFSDLPDGLFAGKGVNDKLDLSNNKFVTIRGGPFIGVENFQISFEGNPVAKIQKSFVDDCADGSRTLTLSGPCYTGTIQGFPAFDKTAIPASCIIA